jgi:hypothetical protein
MSRMQARINLRDSNAARGPIVSALYEKLGVILTAEGRFRRPR